MPKFTKILATLIFAAATQIAGVAAAAPADIGQEGPARVVVPYGDLNLDTARGVQTLRARLNAAVDRVGGSVDVRDLAGQAASRRAHRQAMEMADALLAAHRANLAFAGPTQLRIG